MPFSCLTDYWTKVHGTIDQWNNGHQEIGVIPGISARKNRLKCKANQKGICLLGQLANLAAETRVETPMGQHWVGPSFDLNCLVIHTSCFLFKSNPQGPKDGLGGPTRPLCSSSKYAHIGWIFCFSWLLVSLIGVLTMGCWSLLSYGCQDPSALIRALW